MSHPSDDDWKKMAKLVDTFANKPESEPFREPVPWKVLGLMDYPLLIKEPMDFGTIQSKLKATIKKQQPPASAYKSLYDVNHDVRRIWSNCMTYNADGSDFYKLAESLQKKWDDKYAKLLHDLHVPGATTTSAAAAAAHGGGGGGGNAAAGTGITTTTERRAFAKSLYQLSKEDLGSLLVLVEQKCPPALTKNASEDQVELNIDKMGDVVIRELQEFCNKAHKKTSVSNKKKRTG